MAHDKKYGHLNIPGIPDDEMVFIIRAKDKAAPLAILAYGDAAEHVGASPDFVNEIKQISHDFGAWQAAHLDAVKIPD